MDKENSSEKPLLIHDKDGLSLAWNGMLLRCDFSEMIPRLRPGRLESELIVKASGILKANATAPLAIDATAGLGEDSLLLAAAGFRVILYEKDDLVFSLLKDAVDRARALPSEPEYAVLKTALSRMEIYNADSVEAMLKLAKILDKSHADSSECLLDSQTQSTYARPDIIFLDPMFPQRQKSSMVGKKLQILQQLEKPCLNESQLLEAALSLRPRRIIIKRPPKGPYLAGIKPTFSYSGKSIRIDCIVCANL